VSEQVSARQCAARAAALGVLTVTLALVLFITMRTPLKDDVAWLIYVARKWMGGQQLYVDLIEVNPPLIIWLSAIPALLGTWLGVMGRVVAMPYFAVIILASAWWSTALLQRLGPPYQDRITVFAGMATVLMLIPANELGQREHLLVAIALPYLCVVTLSLHRLDPGRWNSLIAGALAAAACALKPRFVIAFAMVEAVALIGGLRPWRWVNVGAGAVISVYVAGILLLYPAYLDHAVPLALAVYGVSDATTQKLLEVSYPMLASVTTLGLVLVAALRARQSERWALAVLFAFALASVLVFFLARKEWFYHRLPALITATLGLVLWLAAAVQRSGRTAWPRPALFASTAAGLMIVVMAFTTGQRMLPKLLLAADPEVSTEARLERLLKKEKARSYVAFSEWIALGFPVVNNTDVTWASRFDSMWALNGELWRAKFDPNAARDWPVRRWVVRDFIAGCPDVVAVDVRAEPNYIGVLVAADAGFAELWRNYTEIAAFDGLRVYRRQSPDCTGLYTGTDIPTGLTAKLR